ncbi:hypothetical protein GGR53DRAFT_469294 [Hypoxylon sp. FL1150]|nr:hypothetical protein GGR53DRAFT_469294 [Hypoxylon sp. FL1150]
MDMDNARNQARAAWLEAQEKRSGVVAKIHNLKKERANGNENSTASFQEVEVALADLRLACMKTIFFDIEYAAAKNVEPVLWQAHSNLNGQYRQTMLSQGQVVVKRKLERQYKTFLKTSESFYCVYISKLHEQFHIRELQHIAQGTDIQLTTTNSDSTTAPELSAIALKSCQYTLVHLGDLARYRFQLSDINSDKDLDKPKHPSFDKALEYYGLANALNVDEGLAHNQMAVLHQLREEHLDIVYHFHRSLCVKKPHPLGLNNIGQKFAMLESAPAPRRTHHKNSCEAMVTWFLRLHAFFFQGEEFSQQSELETEVLHRIELAVKSENNEVLLCKMILINIAAYDVALGKVNKSWTMAGSRSAQFLLRFNIRTVLVLLRQLKAGLLDESATSEAPVDDSQSTGNGESPLCFSQLLMNIIPLIRIYIPWIYVSRADANNYREHLEPYISQVYQLLAESLTLLNATIDKISVTTTSSKYLLPEDAEMLGLIPFNNQDLPLFFQPEDLSPTRANKARKPRQKAFGHRYQPHTEAVWRIRDVVYCGILLVQDTTYPFALSLGSYNGGFIECWSFADDAMSRTGVDEACMSRMLNKLKFGGTETRTEMPASRQSRRRPSEGGMAVAGPSSGNHTDPELRRRLDKGKAVVRPAPETDLIRDEQMIDMVNKLLDMDNDPGQGSRSQSSQTHTDTSYGMNTATANDIFGGLHLEPAQPSPKFRAIPTLSWDYFYAPSPPRFDSRGSNVQSTSNGNYVPRSVQDQPDGSDSSLYLDSMIMRRSPTEGTGLQVSGPLQGISAHRNHRSTRSRDSLEVSRNAVLDSINSSLYAQHGLAPNTLQPSESTKATINNAFGPFQSTPATFASPCLPETGSPQLRNGGRMATPNYMERSVSQRTTDSFPQGKDSKARLSVRPGQNGGSQSRLGGILRDSSSDEDEEMGLPNPGSQEQTRARNARRNVAPGPHAPYPHSPWPRESANTESLTFSHPSSLFGGTPAPAPAPLNGHPNMLFSNGNYYNASTPFGRLGPDYNSRDDPTSFRNQLQSFVGDSTFDAYDKTVLESAFLEDNGKPAKK